MLNLLKGVFASCQRHEVRYLVIDGIAAVLHGVPRATFDLDILIETTPDNAQRLLDALQDADLGTAALTTADELLAPDITILNDRVRIDVMTVVPGMRFHEAWPRREKMAYQGQSFYVASRPDLIDAKRASGRPVDLEDVRLLTLDDAPES